MYAKGMSQRDIADTIEDICGFEISHDTISGITDRVIETADIQTLLALLFEQDVPIPGNIIDRYIRRASEMDPDEAEELPFN